MGIGLFFDGFAYTLGRGGKKAVKQIQDRNKNLKQATVQNGLAQLRRGEVEFRADKNAPISQPHQGAHITEVDHRKLVNSYLVLVKSGVQKKDLLVL